MNIQKTCELTEERCNKSHSGSDKLKIILGFLSLIIMAGQGIQLSNAAPKEPVSNLEGVVYVVSNDPVDNGNAILGYRRDHAGSLTPLPGSPFLTGGKGYATKEKEFGLPHFGPFDLGSNAIFPQEGWSVLITFATGSYTTSSPTPVFSSNG